MNKRHLITTEKLPRDDIFNIFSTAKTFKKEHDAPSNTNLKTLKSKIVINFFAEASTRTRVGFEIAAKSLGAEVINIEGSHSSLSKGESLKDTVKTLEALNADVIVMRHSAAGACEFVTQQVDIPVINAGDGAHQHPTQALLDGFTLLEHFGSDDLEGKKITILGDIISSRVARSDIYLLKTLGARITLGGPPALVPKYFESLGVNITHDLKDAVKDADAVMTLRIQHERQDSMQAAGLNEYKSLFGLNRENEHLLKKDAVILHPGPVNEGVELDAELANSGRSLILKQVKNGLYIRMAVLELYANQHIHR